MTPSLAIDGVAVTAFNNKLQAPRRLAYNLGISGAPTQTIPPNIRAGKVERLLQLVDVSRNMA
jgi:hypothetical protein